MSLIALQHLLGDVRRVGDTLVGHPPSRLRKVATCDTDRLDPLPLNGKLAAEVVDHRREPETVLEIPQDLLSLVLPAWPAIRITRARTAVPSNVTPAQAEPRSLNPPLPRGRGSHCTYPYSYVNGNPLNMMDPDGHRAIDAYGNELSPCVSNPKSCTPEAVEQEKADYKKVYDKSKATAEFKPLSAGRWDGMPKVKVTGPDSLGYYTQTYSPPSGPCSTNKCIRELWEDNPGKCQKNIACIAQWNWFYSKGTIEHPQVIKAPGADVMMTIGFSVLGWASRLLEEVKGIRAAAPAANAGPAKMSAAMRALLAQKAGFTGTGPKIIVDENLSPTIAAGLRNAGYDARSVSELRLAGQRTSDASLSQLASQLEARVLTRDRGRQLDGGFGRLGIQVDRRATTVDSILRILGSSE